MQPPLSRRAGAVLVPQQQLPCPYRPLQLPKPMSLLLARSPCWPAGDLHKGLAIMKSDHDVRWLDVSMNDSLLVCVLNSPTNIGKQFQSIWRVQAVLVTEVCDRNSLNQFHHKVG